MELRGIGTTRQWSPVEVLLVTAQENRVTWSITIDPTVVSRSNFFHEFQEAVFDGVTWNGYDMATASGHGHSTDGAREPGQKVLNLRYDRWIAHKYLSRVFEGYFPWSCVEAVPQSDVVRSGHTTDCARVPGQKVHNYRSDRWIVLKFLS